MTNPLMPPSLPTSPSKVRTYVVNFDAAQTNLPAFNQYLKDGKEIVKFWNYVPLSYFVKTHLPAAELRERLAPFFSGRYFIVAEVNVFNVDGLLPQTAWDWFYDRPTKQEEDFLAGISGLFSTPKS